MSNAVQGAGEAGDCESVKRKELEQIEIPHAPTLVRAPLARVEVLRADDGHDAARGVQARRRGRQASVKFIITSGSSLVALLQFLVELV